MCILSGRCVCAVSLILCSRLRGGSSFSFDVFTVEHTAGVHAVINDCSEQRRAFDGFGEKGTKKLEAGSST